MRTKDGAVPRQSLQGQLGLVDRATEQRPKDVSTAEAAQQVRQAKFHLLASFVADHGACLGQPRMDNFALTHVQGD